MYAEVTGTDHIVMLLHDRAIEGSPAQLKQSNDPEVVDFLTEDADPLPSPRAAGRAAAK